MDENKLRLIGFIIISVAAIIVLFFARHFDYVTSEIFIAVFLAVLGAWGIGLTYKVGERAGMKK